MEDLPVLEEQGVVVGGVQFDPELALGVREHVAHRAEHLRCRAHRVGLLEVQLGAPHPAVALSGVPHLVAQHRVFHGAAAARQQRPHVRGGVDLPGVGPRHLVPLGEERAGRPAQRLGQQRGDDLRLPDLGQGAVDDQGAETGHRGGPVDQRQAFLEPQFERLDAPFPQHRAGRDGGAVPQQVALPDEGGGDVGQRGEVTTGTQRADLGDGGGQPEVEVQGQPFQYLGAHRRVPLGQRVQPRGEDGPGLVLGEERPHPGAVAADQVGLEFHLVVRPDEHVDHLAEPGGDPVHRGAVVDDVLEQLP